MKTALLMGLALVALAFVVPTAEACNPPNCPTRCDLETEDLVVAGDDPVPTLSVPVPTGYRCAY